METTILLLSVFLVLFRKNLFKIPLSEKIEITRLRSVISYIEENFKKKITLDELALVSGFSVGHFSSFFKKGTGKTPIEYLNEVRINKAREKLLTTDESVTSISLECGFENLGYFIRLFKKTNGSSPKIWRKSTKQ
ncbi:MAG: helix-turn-helix transcriptional regulator [Clostridia bacterium]|nr:helix-turn-helix transcriptional regulator [Clostridia bacterium]